MNYKLAVAITAVLAVSNPVAAQQGPSIDLEATFLNADPYPVESGEDAEVRFKITNQGDVDVDDVRVSVLDTYPFELKPDRKRNYSLGTVAVGNDYYITSEVLVAEDAPDGENDLRVRISHEDGSEIEKVPIDVQSEQIELNIANLKTTPTSLKPDTDDAKLSLEVVNNGEKTAENVVVDLDLPEGFERTSSFSSRQSLGNVAAGEVKSAEFVFDVAENASAGNTRIPAEISYTAGDSTSEITEDAGFDLYLSGKPQFEVVSSESDLSVGGDGEIRLRIRNTGAEKSESTRVRILDNSDLPFSFDSSNRFLGTLNSGAEGSVVFDTSVENSAVAKQYLMDFEIRGVSNSEVYVEEKVRTVEVAETSSTSTPPVLPIAGAVLAVLAAAAYFFREKLPLPR